MRGKRGVVFLLLILSVILLTTGCWNRKELDRLAIVAAVGIDKGEDQKIKLTVQVIKPGALKSPSSEGGSGKEEGVWIIKSSGNTIFDAVRNFVEKSGRKLFWPHTMVIVIGENMAKDGLLPVIDWFLRDHEMRLQTWVLVTQGEASEVIKGDSGLEKIPASHLEGMIKDSGALSKDVNSNLGEQMCTEDLANPEMIAVLEDEQRQAVEKEIIALIRKAQEEYKLDILGLGEATMREFPKEWNKVKEQWEEEFPQVEVEVKVNSMLSLTGMMKSLKTQK